MNHKIYLFVIVLLVIAIAAVVLFIIQPPWLFPKSAASTSAATDGRLHFYALGTGDSDALVVIAPEGKVMLVDTGTSNSYSHLYNFLTEKGIRTIDVLVLTHPHADHIGGAAMLLSDFSVGELYGIKTGYTSELVTNLNAVLAERNIQPLEAKAGVTFSLGSVQMKFLAPLGTYEDLKDCSDVLQFSHGDNTFLLMGDAEQDAEDDLIATYGDSLRSDLIKAGHHGAKNASKADFLEKVRPGYAVMTGDNAADPDHVHEKAIERYRDIGAAVYRTDLNGDIAVVSDGKTLSITTEK